jgi:hypothetical protein
MRGSAAPYLKTDSSKMRATQVLNRALQNRCIGAGFAADRDK